LIVYRLLGQGTAYEEPEPKHPSEDVKQKTLQRHLRELAKRGFSAPSIPNEAIR